LGTGGAAAAGATEPKNPEAYGLYLRSTAISRDPAPNKEAVRMLEQSVQLDGSYAPAWNALADRYYYDGSYSDGGGRAIERSRAAAERALSLDPNLVPAVLRLILLQVEGGDLNGAWDRATELARSRPENAESHFTLAYVLRYGGMLDESARECEKALSLDPRNYRWRSCSLSFAQLQRYDRAMDFVNLDPGSEWNTRQTVVISIRRGNLDEAARRNVAREDPLGAWLQRCLARRPPALDGPLPAGFTESILADRDSEPKYHVGSLLAFCGERKTALQMLRRAVDENYCSYPAMDSDPLLASIRGTPEFAEIRRAGIECQRRFLTHRASKGGSPAPIPHALH
ncbi:MAG: tetratricopeptide repeat protein, partial [Acidobacteriota bacterium]|nr:tetratricopeptide repeat protein [Acidobacteriota bacterium]MDQ5871470.1 tetratricopeptide repeat protein [Acidobacteriota bacterium]